MFFRSTEPRTQPLHELAGRWGFRRVELVRIDGDDATVTGVLHRYPHAVRVPRSVAEELVAAGAPHVVGPEVRS